MQHTKLKAGDDADGLTKISDGTSTVALVEPLVRAVASVSSKNGFFDILGCALPDVGVSGLASAGLAALLRNGLLEFRLRVS